MIWSNEELNILKENYSKSDWNIIHKLLPKRTDKSIRYKAEELRISRQFIYKTKVNFDYKFFDELNNENAYVLGFIYADGCVLDRPIIKISVSVKDIEHLKNIQLLMKSNQNLRVNKKDIVCSTFSSRYTHSKLLELGLTPRKSLTTEFPNISEKYVSHFIRGYFDGDGSINYSIRANRKNYKEWRLSIIGSESFLTSVSDIFHNKCNTKQASIIKRSYSNIYDINYSVKDMVKIGRFIYHDATIKLGRKYEKFIDFFNDKHISLEDNQNARI